MNDPIGAALAEYDVLVLDGAMATELERRGANLRDNLWSAKILMENPDLIRQVHADYYAAGADIAITASYQATFAGFATRGLDADAAAALMRLSVQLACAARDAFWAAYGGPVARPRPLVAASVGPYGAYLANGAEYTGDYGISRQELKAFHGPRLAVLAESGADLLACETIPSLEEAEVLVELLEEVGSMPAWLSFSCADGERLNHGERFSEAVALANRCEQVVAVGVNCTPPRFLQPLLEGGRTLARKPFVVYPNRGEGWDAVNHCWLPLDEPLDFAALARTWRAAGARLFGGCCRTTPDDIRLITASLRGQDVAD